MRARVAAGLVVLTLLAGCSSSRDSKDATPSSVPAPDERVAWTREDVVPIAKPAVAGDTVVVLAREGRRLFVLGLDEKDGSTRWRQEASPSGVLQGISLYPAVIGEQVYVVAPERGRDLFARLLRLDPATGRAVWRSAPAVFDSQPAPCDDGKDICISASADEDEQGTMFRFAASDGTRAPEPGAPDGARGLGVGLFDLGPRDPEVLAYVNEGAVRWQKPLTDVFGSGFSTDGGWDFLRYANPDAFIGSVGDEYVEPQPDHVDLAHVAVAALRATDGTLLWRDDGSSFACWSSIRLPRDPLAPPFPEPEVWPVRCRAHGIIRMGANESSEPSVESLAVALEGFDPVTGHTTWSFKDGPARELVGLDDFAMQVASDSSIAMPTANGTVVIDLATGATRPLGDLQLLWCVTEVSFDYREAFYDDSNQPDYERLGGSVAKPCGPGAAQGHGRWDVPRVVGVPAGDVTVVAEPKAVVAYRA